jgi:uncharacterized protein YcbK (DUF882 family)
MKGNFKCPCCGQGDISNRLKSIIQTVEQILGTELIIKSGYRCKKYNALVGGSSDSAHMKGLAADISFDNNVLQSRLISLFTPVVTGIGIGDGYIHVDIDDKPKRTWICKKSEGPVGDI